MHRPDEEEPVAGENQPMDLQDLQLLSDIVALYDTVDPMPEILPDVILFALEAHDVDAELARLVDAELSLVGTRAVEHARSVTFSSDHLTVMVALTPTGEGSVRVDGWAAPGGFLRTELRTGDATFETQCDADGRFAFESVPTGAAQFTLSPTADSDPEIRIAVVTPAVHL
jgi:hypothetical protein